MYGRSSNWWQINPWQGREEEATIGGVGGSGLLNVEENGIAGGATGVSRRMWEV